MVRVLFIKGSWKVHANVDEASGEGGEESGSVRVQLMDLIVGVSTS